MNYSGYDHNHQYPHQELQHAYDPSLIQSSEAYYGYSNQQYNHQNAYYSTPYAQQAHQQFQQDPNSIHPPGVPIPPEPAHVAAPGQTQLQSQQLNPVSVAAVAGSINPSAAAAAVAALSQLTHYASGNTDVAQTASHSASQYRGGGGRGGRPFRGGGRGHFNHRGLSRYRGRGRGQAGRHFPSHSSASTVSIVSSASAAAEGTLEAKPSSSFPEQMQSPIPAQVPAVPLQPPPPRKEWCEICKVECNTPEIMEQHKNGKRHKKNMQVHEELQRHKAIIGQQGEQMPASQLNVTVQPAKVLDSKQKGFPTENMGSEAATDNHKNEIELLKDIGETSEVPAEEPDEKPSNSFAAQGRGFKRKMRGGRGGKYMRTNDGHRRSVEPPKPKQAIPFICELCNVKCESQVVFDSHLTGKKHLSSLKRVHGRQALHGEAGLQALYPPDINALSNSINSQVQQGVSDPQVLLAQLLMNIISQVQVPAVAPAPGPLPAQVPAPVGETLAAGSSYEPQFQNVSQTQVSESTAHVETVTGDTKYELPSVPAELDPPTGSIISTQTADGSAESEGKVLNLSQDNSAMPRAENAGVADDRVPSQ